MNTIYALSALAVITLFLGAFNFKKSLLPVIVIGLFIAFALSIPDWGVTKSYFNNMFITNNFTISFGGILLVGTIAIFLLASQYYKDETRSLEGIYSILIFSLLGGLLMISSGNLSTFFIGLEILSVSLYLLAGSHKTSIVSHEAAMKYFLMGAFASAFLLFGIALLYGATGSLNNHEISAYIQNNKAHLPLLLKAGIILVAIGLSFKVAAAPFHFWAPDVYHGSPTLITAYMVTVVKVAGFAAFYQITTTCFGPSTAIWTGTLAVISALSIVIGNFSALNQSRPKRMLAYSSISHTGYLLIAIVAAQISTPDILYYYSIAYSASNLVAFAVLISIKQTINNASFESFNGIAKSNPVVAICMSIAMLSLTGIPPLAGFVGKYLLLAPAMQQGYIWLVVIAIIGSIVSIFYYFKPIINMYMKPQEGPSLIMDKLSVILIVLLTIITLTIGLVPGVLFKL